ncbi:MAG: hypothetical protein CL608_29225 [Anaerolineaceae bacterium]|nr:hypothetical protein [Anaerolineaceae bacterium]
MKIEKAIEHDLNEILTLFNKTQSWLIEQGYEAQWGIRPFTENPGQIERFKHWLAHGTFYVLRHEGSIVSTLVIGDQAPAYTLAAFTHPPQTLYLEAFATNPAYRGKGIGKMLLQWAEQEAEGKKAERLRLDCWAGNHALRKYYQSAGFQEVGEFQVHTWPGVLFEKQADWLKRESDR